MDKTPKDLSKYRIERAEEELKIAKTLLSDNFFAKSLNSSYYAMFYAARALLAFEKVDSKKHSGVISFFNNHFVRPGRIPHNYFQFLSTAFNIRLQSDYKDFYVATKDEAEKQIQNAEKFIEMTKN